MSAINDLSKLGYDSLQKEFFDKDDDGNIKLNEERFAKYLRKQLTDRDADNNRVDGNTFGCYIKLKLDREYSYI